MGNDFRVSLRLLGRDKAYAFAVASTLALCLGANAALYSVVHHLLLRPLPVPEPERILIMSNLYPNAGATDSSNSGVTDYYDRKRDVTVLEEQALFNTGNVSLETDGRPTRVRVLNVTPSWLRVMKTAPALGRPFTEAEGELGNERKLLLSDAFWRSQHAADPAVVGRTLRLDGQPYEVVGVLPARLEALSPGIGLVRPLAFTPEEKSDERRHSNNYWHVGRLEPGATLEQARSQVDALNAANLDRFPHFREPLLNAGFHTKVERLSDHLVRHVEPVLYLLWGGASFVLLIGVFNVLNLVLVRARSRAKELATRVALGAATPQLARQLVVENVLLALVAATSSMLIAALALRAASSFELSELPYASEIGLGLAPALYATGIALAIGLVMALVPLASTLGQSPSAQLRVEGRGATGSGGARVLRRSLVVGQVAFTFVLLLGAGLLLASFAHVLRVDTGFDPARVTTASVSLPRVRYEEEVKRRAFYDATLGRLRAIPGVSAAGATTTIPFGGSYSDSVILAEGYVMKPGESLISPQYVAVTPGYFEAMGARLVRGRFFDERDVETVPAVAIVDERLARRFWPDQDPVGRRLYLPSDINNLTAITDKTVLRTVVGVVADVKLRGLTEQGQVVGAYYFPMAQDTARYLTFAVKSRSDDPTVAASLRAAIAAVDPELPVFDVKSMQERTDRALLDRRGPAQLAVGFGVVALLLAAVGLYGVLAYLVSQRGREIAVRLALGSTPRAVFELVLREGLVLLGLGLLLGGAGAVLLRSGLESQLFGIRASDPRVMLAVVVLLSVVTLAACALPARRAARIEPRTVLGA
jgi:predicted permease